MLKDNKYGVTFAQGFKAAGIKAGIKKSLLYFALSNSKYADMQQNKSKERYPYYSGFSEKL